MAHGLFSAIDEAMKENSQYNQFIEQYCDLLAKVFGWTEKLQKLTNDITVELIKFGVIGVIIFLAGCALLILILCPSIGVVVDSILIGVLAVLTLVSLAAGGKVAVQISEAIVVTQTRNAT